MCVGVLNHQRLLKMDSWISSLEKEIDDVDKDITQSVPNLNLVRKLIWPLCSSPGCDYIRIGSLRAHSYDVAPYVRILVGQATGKMSTHELLKGLTALREKVDPSVLEQTLKGAITPTLRALQL